MKRVYQKYKDLKYRYKLTILTILAGVLPVAIIVAYMQYGMIRILKDKELDTMEKSLNQSVEAMENQVQIYENLVNYLSYSQELRNVLRGEQDSDYENYIQYSEIVDPLLQMPQVYHQEIQGITIYSERIEVPHGTELVPLSELEQEVWYPKVSEGQLMQWFVRRGANREVIAARKFYDDKDITAVLTMQLDYEKLLAPFSNLLKENTGGIICDSEGNVIYSGYSMDAEYRPQKAESLEYIRANYTCSEQTMENIGWTFYLYRPTEIITKSANQLTLRNIPIVGICIVLLAVLGYVFSRTLVSRLELLTENMNQIHLGFRKVTVSSDSKDEVGVLVRSFRRMMDEINKLITEVYEAKIELQHMEMRALQAQINPHFLYNSLSIINWKAIEAGEDEISRVTLDLSTYYRTSLNRGETMTSVESEINNVRSYLRIQLIMHDHNFRVIEEIDEKTFDCHIPKLILQPLVENAIDHGLDSVESEDKRLTVAVKQEGEILVFQVRDNGSGMSREQAEKILGFQSSGYGVHNVYGRIKLLYKEKGCMTIQSEEGKGTCVEIRIPGKMEGS